MLDNKSKVMIECWAMISNSDAVRTLGCERSGCVTRNIPRHERGNPGRVQTNVTGNDLKFVPIAIANIALCRH